ncbi:hypothetical protein AB0O18_29920 [Streptomyces sp. NPDC093224]|uniref:hypothetical protein n=1 Tax=Streptomyces sp. NPDC093224 TaxID=3155198 RepID=UPI0034428843
MNSTISVSGSVSPRHASMFLDLLDAREDAAGRPKKGCAFCTLCIAAAGPVPSPHRKERSPIR